ncbi:MAG TPA: alkaline phosphatase [Bacillus bacterium]|nr:alkaline phosphatase [Bacillus sp. (in: firmicutes)]
MDYMRSLLLILVESGGWYAPALFILFHILRQFLFIPPAVVCIAGGLLFGILPGIIYSLIGLSAASIVFFILIEKVPETMNKLSKLKKRLFGPYRDLTISQVALLRLIPFINYHLLSFCLFDRKRNFNGFMRASFFANIPFVIFYTAFGEYIGHFNVIWAFIMIGAILIFAYMLREKIAFIKWREFFKPPI